jgi:UTP--glucose-1-phosphate uridylyltransferase
MNEHAAQAGRAPVRKAVIPAAGVGTRLLPLTKAVPKELFPIVDKPVLQLIIEEAVATGIEEILLIVSNRKNAIRAHFGDDADLEAFLTHAGKASLVDQVRRLSGSARLHYIEQKEQRGLGDAIYLAREFVGSDPFAVLLGDCLIDAPIGTPSGLQQLVDVHREFGGVVAVEEVPREMTSRYGIVAGERIEDAPRELLRLRELVEKPDPAAAPSRLAVSGRYVLPASIFTHLERTGRGVGGEIQLTDALNCLAQAEPFYALAWSARRYDIGDPISYARCFLEFALRRDDVAAALRPMLLDHLRETGQQPSEEHR